MSTLQLLRHGQASFGAARYDCLSEMGARQSQHVGQFFEQREQAFDAVFIGPRQRHQKTSALALAGLSAPGSLAVDERLDEFAEGQQILAAAQANQAIDLTSSDAIRGKQAARHYSIEIQSWAEARTDIPGVATAREFRQRVADWRDELTGKTRRGQRVLAVTSGGVIAALVADALGLPDSRMAGLMNAIFNASLTELAYGRDRPATLVTFNAIGHLDSSLITRI